MKKILLAAILSVVLVVGIYGLPAFAAKPVSVISWSNGFPSGDHFNLNIHGKKTDFVCDSTPGGGSLFVPEFGNSLIQMIENRKSSITGLYVSDPCSFGQNDPAKVQLPYGEYQVYTRILGKPGKPKSGDVRSVVFYPRLIDACNDNAIAPIDGFGDYIDCSQDSLVGMGVVTYNDAFDKDSQTLERVAPLNGNNKAVEVTDLFQWSGLVCNESVDIDGDGEITVADVPLTYDTNGVAGIQEDELQNYLNDLLASGTCKSFNSEWIFNIADLVVYGWDYQNNGAKLVQVRFYPVDTTVFN